jgi:NAD+ synthase (glutamine-hydrolysing)
MVRDITQKVDRAEYKRKQSPPGLKITYRAFGFGRPFPIAQKYQP